MFTGLIEQVGRIEGWQRAGTIRRLTIAHGVWEEACLKPGDSIAVNGACLTAETVSPRQFVCAVLDETVARTSLVDKPVGSRVNLERAMLATARFGGHMVQGHVDALGTVADISNSGLDRVLKLRCPSAILAGIVEKGSVALDGISLTVATLDQNEFAVHIIPFTWTHTALCDLTFGMGVNIETDIIGKYVQHYLVQQGGSGLSADKLRSAGGWMG